MQHHTIPCKCRSFQPKRSGPETRTFPPVHFSPGQVTKHTTSGLYRTSPDSQPHPLLRGPCYVSQHGTATNSLFKSDWRRSYKPESPGPTHSRNARTSTYSPCSLSITASLKHTSLLQHKWRHDPKKTTPSSLPSRDIIAYHRPQIKDWRPRNDRLRHVANGTANARCTKVH